MSAALSGKYRGLIESHLASQFRWPDPAPGAAARHAHAAKRAGRTSSRRRKGGCKCRNGDEVRREQAVAEAHWPPATHARQGGITITFREQSLLAVTL
jgi:hypothetical protein